MLHTQSHFVHTPLTQSMKMISPRQQQQQQQRSLSALLMVATSALLLALLAMLGSSNVVVEGFVPTTGPTTAMGSRSSSSVSSPPSSTSSSALSMVGPLQKVTNKQEYNRVVEGLMLTQGITRQQAEQEYNAYLDNPNNYALNKGEAYYKSLGYKSLMDGVIGEAEKEGRGEEVRARIEAFKKKSQLKGLSVITIATAILFYYNTVNPYTPPPHL